MSQAPDDPDYAAAPRLRRSYWRDPVVLLATGFGSGFLRPAPGTWGTLVGLAVWWLALAGLPWLWQLAVAAAVFAAGMAICHHVGRRYGVHDDPGIVVDEWVGLWVALLAAPATPAAAALGFLVFRVFDIAKPWPVGWADRRLSGALGVMIDDVLAGVLALAVLQLAFRLITWPPLSLTS